MNSPHSDLTVQPPSLHPDPIAPKPGGESEWFHPGTLHLWLLTILISALAIAAMNYRWLNVQRSHEADTTIVHDQSELEEFLRKNHDTREFTTEDKPYRIPTGFYIQSLAFVAASDVNITGYIWQKYPADFPDIEKGIVFPEEVDSKEVRVEEVYRDGGEQDGIQYELIGWYFDVTVRQSFDYSNYPLDILTVWLRIWPKEFKEAYRILLVPDFHAYAKTGKSTFGLDTEIVHGEWEIDETFFSYKDVPYDTNFGFFSEAAEEHSFKEFFFNIAIRRKFINAFVINLVPLFGVALLLFAQLLIVSGKKELVERFGSSVNDAIVTCSAVFFVILLAHTQVRSQFPESGLVYIEYFYLIMYLAISLSAANMYIFSLGEFRCLNLIHYKDNLISKLVYWPVLLWLMAIATWAAL